MKSPKKYKYPVQRHFVNIVFKFNEIGFFLFVLGIFYFLLIQNTYGDVVTNDFQNEASYAKQVNSSKLPSSLNTFSPSQDIPGYNPSPTQTQYSKNSSAITTDAANASKTDGGAQAVSAQFSSGPKYTIDPNSPSMQKALIAQQDAYNIAHGVPDKYTDCKPEQNCKPSFTTGSCTMSQSTSFDCHNTLNVDVTYDENGYPCNHIDISNPFQPKLLPGPDSQNQCIAGLVTFLYTDFLKNKTQQISQHQIVEIPSNTQIKLIASIVSIRDSWDENFSASATINADNVSASSEANEFHPNVKNIASFQSGQSESSINVNYTGRYAFGWHHVFDIPEPAIIMEYISYPKVPKPVISEQWVNSCDNQAYLNQCQASQKICTQPGSTKIINGVSVTEPCWQYTTNYLCGSNSNNCQAYQGCDQIGSECSASIGSLCIQYKQTYECPTKQCDTSGMVCGGDFFCLNGNCSMPTPTQNKNFGQDAARLAAVSGAAAQFQGNPSVQAFTGQAMSCSMAPIGFLNCCADNGWGKQIGLAKCSNEEKQLGAAKEKGVTVYVGNYCSKKVLGICTEHRKGYCNFNSKLALDVQLGGRQKQLGINFGSGKHPQCQGLTLNQIQSIDFSKIDFSNVAEDMQSNAKFPNQTDVNNAISQHIRQEVGQ